MMPSIASSICLPSNLTCQDKLIKENVICRILQDNVPPEEIHETGYLADHTLFLGHIVTWVFPSSDWQKDLLYL